jgi:hypothetical protein
MQRILLVLSLSFSSFAQASTGFHSQFSHFSGGLVMTVLAAYLLVRFFKTSERRALIWSFWFSTVFVFISQTRDYLRADKFWNQAMDFLWHTVGTLLALYLAHKLFAYMHKRAVAASGQDGS